MKMRNLKIIIAIAMLFQGTMLFAQTTTTILYDATSNLSTTKCTYSIRR